MKRFLELFERLDQTTKTNEKVAAIADYFSVAAKQTPHDAAWAMHYLSGRRAKRLVKTNHLRTWAAREAGIPDWLFDESYDSVGDLAETISLIVPTLAQCTSEFSERSFSEWVNKVLSLGKLDEADQHRHMVEIWRCSGGTTRLILMKLITGSFRLGVSAKLVTRGLANATGLPAEVLAHRLMGHWNPDAAFIERLISIDTDDAVQSRPYPFCLAHAIPPAEITEEDDSTSDPEAADIGSPDEFIAEWKWDGIRGQMIRRRGVTYLWSRGEDLMSDRWPEIETAAEFLPDGTVIDGEILASQIVQDVVEVLPFAQLQRRIGRKTVGKTLLADVPVMFHAFDLLEVDGNDIRHWPLHQRRERMEKLFIDHAPPHCVLNPPIRFDSWSELTEIRRGSREVRAEGVMLKRLDSTYSVGRVRGTWWKWKVSPYTIDAVLVYAQRGHGKRASVYSDYTFAIWKGDQLVPFAKAYSGLTDAEIRRVDRFVRDNTTERFGPVRSVTPTLVMELAFEGLQRSTRHKSGIATRFPRIVRWRDDKTPADADRLEDLLAMLGDGP